MNRVAVISANIGNFETPVPYVEQSVPYDLYLFNDENFPRRSQSMAPRLQARIPKMFGWQMAPGHEYYLWVDSSCALLDPNSIQWFIDQMDGRAMAFFKHPHRNTIAEEAEYLKKRLAMPDTYITSRYKGELLDEQMADINKYGVYKDDLLIATTAFIYRNSWDVQQMLKEWWYHTSRYHVIDQLALPYVIKHCHMETNVKIIPDNFMKIKYLSCVRK